MIFNQFGLARTILIASIAFMTIACQPKSPALTEQEALKMKTLTANMAPHCFGRYLIDLPEDFVLNTEGGQEIEEIRIDILPMKESEFKLLLSNRKAELENIVLPGKGKYPALRAALPIADSAHGIIFDRAESDSSSSRMGRTLELLAWKNGYRILATVNAIDTDFPEFANDSWIKESRTTTTEKLSKLVDVFKRTRGRADHEIPTEQGVCVLNGFVSGPPTDQESVTFFYHLKTTDDVYFRVSTQSLHTGKTTLLERVKDIRPFFTREGERLLRTEHRDVNGMKGEELLYTTRGEDPLAGENQAMVHNFVFEANGKTGSAMSPIVTIDLVNGNLKPEPDRKSDKEFPLPITKATLIEGEILALWDTVIPTMRRRPGAF